MEHFELNPPSRRWIVRQILVGLALTLVTVFALVFRFTDQYDVTVGSVAPRDIRSPQDITYESETLSQQAREEAMREVASVYTRPAPDVARQQLQRLRQVLEFLSAVRADPFATEAQKASWVLAVDELESLSANNLNTLFALSDAGWSRVQLEARGLLDQVMRSEEIRPGNLDDQRQRIPVLVPLDLAQDEANLVAALVQRFIVPNSFYDEEATERARLRAAEESEPVRRTVRSGEIIVREGSVVNELSMEALRQLGLTAQEWSWRETGFYAVFSLSAVVLLGGFLFKASPGVLLDARLEGMTLLLLSIFLLLERLLLPSGPLLLFLFPIAALGMLLATTIGPAAAAGCVLFISLVGGWIAGPSLSSMALLAFNGVTAALTLPAYEQTGSIFRSGLLGGLAGAVIRLAFFTGEAQFDALDFGMDAATSLAGGVIASGLTLGTLFVLAPLFDLCTTFRLVELTHPNHPLLQRLLREAPATFHHVMMVASLAEQAAERIGANVLLTRAGTYYHDVGKLARPYFFVENQEGISNPHDRLDPLTSADIVIGHVRDGLKIARQYHLPSQVRAFIPEHQGTMLVYFFYHKAVEAANGEEGLVDASQFRYSGPRPQRRETALVMLADGCEAATRAARPSSPEELSGIVESIFQARIADGQLDDCPITLRELDIVRQTYIELLRGAYHPRVKYPDSDEDTSEQ
jgi:hypothetical protein